MTEKDQIVEEWIQQNPIITRWLKNLAKTTNERYKNVAFRFFTWLKESGDLRSPGELVKLQKVAVGDDRYSQLDKIQDWMRSLPDAMRVGTKKMMYSCLRSFYMYSRAELPRDKGFKIRSETAPVEGILTVEGLRKIIVSSNLMYQTVFTTMFQSGMGWQQFQHFNEKDGWKQIKEDIFNEDHKPILIRLPARKHGGSYNRQPFYTFIGDDAKELIRRYLKTLRGQIHDGEAIFLNEKGNPLQRTDARKFFTRHAKACGLIQEVAPLCPECNRKTIRKRRKVNGKHKVFYECECGLVVSCDDPRLKEFMDSFKTVRHGINLHEIRDVYRSTWEISPASPTLAEFCLGHDIDSNHYNKFYRNIEFTTKEYMKAQPYLNILSEDPLSIKKADMEEIIEKKVAERLKQERERLFKEIEAHLDAKLKKLGFTRHEIKRPQKQS